jgi:hypothetical protein
MATIKREVVNARPEAARDAIRDVGAVHERLAPGFVVDTVLKAVDPAWCGSRISCRMRRPRTSAD